MHKGRLEAFSDGVFAIIITIMVLELKVPHGGDLAALRDSHALGIFLTYVLSYIYVGIYWNNHHHLFQSVQKINGRTLWANLHLLFWLSLFPFMTGWMGGNHFEKWPTAIYGIVLFCAAVAWAILTKNLVALHDENSVIVRAQQNHLNHFKEKISPVLYLIGIAMSFISPAIACGIYILVALLWFVPDRRIERLLNEINEKP